MNLQEKYSELLCEISDRANSSNDVNSGFFTQLEKVSPLIKSDLENIIENRIDTSRSHLVTLLRTSFENITGINSKHISELTLREKFADPEFMKTYRRTILHDNSSNSDVRRALPLKAFISVLGYSQNSYTLLDFGCGHQIHLLELFEFSNLSVIDNISVLDINHHISQDISPRKIYAIEKNLQHRNRLQSLSYGCKINIMESISDLVENMDLIMASTTLYQLHKDIRVDFIDKLKGHLQSNGWLLINDVFLDGGDFIWASDWGNSSNAVYSTYAISNNEPKPLEIFKWNNSHCKEVHPGRDLNYFVSTYSTISGNTSINS